jgi:predicted nucleotidyltransferase
MAQRNPEINKTILLFLNEVQKKYTINKAYVFGSYAKGTATKWSDIDLAIVSEDFTEDISDDRLYLMKLACKVDDRIEPVAYSTIRFKLNDPLVSEIYKNGIQLI